MKLIFILFQVFCSSILLAQNFTLLESDASGDPSINGIADLKSISYAIDESVDSLWFKIELHTSLPGDLGIVFGIDTDLIPDNGLTWNSPNNTDLLPEVVFTINRNFIDPSFLYGFSNNDLGHMSTFGENDSTIIVNMELSKLDDDGRFNLVLGSSSFDCDTNNRSIFDDLPESGFLTIDITSAASVIYKPTNFYIHPNPVKDHFYLELDENQQLEVVKIYSFDGKLIEELSNADQDLRRINCSNWKAGAYFLSAWSRFGVSSTKFIKIH